MFCCRIPDSFHDPPTSAVLTLWIPLRKEGISYVQLSNGSRCSCKIFVWYCLIKITKFPLFQDGVSSVMCGTPNAISSPNVTILGYSKTMCIYVYIFIVMFIVVFYSYIYIYMYIYSCLYYIHICIVVFVVIYTQ